jgi:MscS family membrane protein
VGGLAVALAAQKTLENLFGGATLIADRPVQVGDFCRFGEKLGTVEEIGMRSTRVRTLERTIVTIPNAEFSSLQLENFGKRDMMKFSPRLGLLYATTPDQLRYVLVEIRRMLYAHPRVLDDPARIRFVGFGDSSLDLEIFAYIDATDFSEYLGIAEDLNLRIMDIVAASGTGFAFPSNTTYLAKDEGSDPEKTRRAEAAVRDWVEREELYLPGFPQAKIDDPDETIEYPSKGAPPGVTK